MTDMQ